MNLYPNRFVHFSTGDLLRNFIKENKDQKEGHPNYETMKLIEKYIKEGLIVPAKITAKLLLDSVINCKQNTILVDGFPRNMENYDNWNEMIKERKNILTEKLFFFTCKEEILWERV